MTQHIRTQRQGVPTRNSKCFACTVASLAQSAAAEQSNGTDRERCKFLVNWKGVRLGVEDETTERQRVLLREDHEQVLEAFAHEKRLHFIQPLRLDLKK